MKFALKSLAVAAAFIAAGSANAASATLVAGGLVADNGFILSDLTGSGTLAFSSSLIGALNAGKITVAGVAPATATVVNKTNPSTKVVSIASASAAAPIQSLTGDYTTTSLTVTEVGTLGGAKQTAATANIATNGGFLEITNLSVNLATKKVFATLNGGNGVGVLNNVELWDVATITGPTTFDLSVVPAGGGVVTSTNTLSGLTINANAYNLFATSLGLTANGKTSLSTVKDFGTITSTISVRVTPDVPEPSTYALMGVGLIGVSLAARRRRAK